MMKKINIIRNYKMKSLGLLIIQPKEKRKRKREEFRLGLCIVICAMYNTTKELLYAQLMV